MITIHLCDECHQTLGEFAGYYRCNNDECEMYGELVGDDDDE